MADAFRIIPPTVLAAGTDVPPEQIQAAINSLAQQTTIALNSVASDPTGPAGGDLSGTYPNPTVSAVHATSGTIDGTPIGGTTPAAGSFTTVAASTAIAPTSGGTGRNALNANAVIIGEGSSPVNFAAPGAAGGMLISQGAAADPAFANNPTITGGSINNAAIGGTTPAAGSFTTVAATGTITPSQTNGIVGTNTNNNANAGSVGEYVTANAAGVSLTNGTPANITSISLTAGDWDVTGVGQFIPAGSTTYSQLIVGVNTTSATFGGLGQNATFSFSSSAAGASSAIPAPVWRFSLSATTTVFLVAQAVFGVSTMTCSALIRARRVR